MMSLLDALPQRRPMEQRVYGIHKVHIDDEVLLDGAQAGQCEGPPCDREEVLGSAFSDVDIGARVVCGTACASLGGEAGLDVAVAFTGV